MTILELKQAQAAILGVTVADLTVLGLDLGIMAANAVRLEAEQLNDFGFQRKQVSLTIDGVTGGSLDNAVLYGTATPANIKTIIDVGQLDTYGNTRPVEWTTLEESLERSREEYPQTAFRRYPTDADISAWGRVGTTRVMFAGTRVTLFPKSTQTESLTLILETYCYSPDWTATSNTVTVAGGTGVTGVNTTYYRFGQYNSKPLYISLAPAGTPAALYFLWHDGTKWVNNELPGTVGSNYHSLTSTSQSPAGTYDNHGTYTGTAVATSADADSTSDIWLTKGFNYLLWASVVWLNNNDDQTLGKKFVPRTEGNLPPPQAQADKALAAFIQNDTNLYELFRRHGR